MEGTAKRRLGVGCRASTSQVLSEEVADRGSRCRPRLVCAASSSGDGLCGTRRTPPVTGLYTSILCLLGYAVFGPSRILVLGPDSALGPMIAATILPLVGANGNPARAIALASLLALFTGAIIAVGGIAKLGFIADLLSKPSILGYMNGLALTILVGQLPKLLGFSIDVHGFIGEAREIVAGVIDGEVVVAAAAVGMGSWLSSSS